MTKRLKSQALVAALAAAALTGFTTTGARAQNFPDKAVRMIVPFTAGGAGDILARTLSQKLEGIWGRGFVVENRTGAGGIIGAVAAQKSPADGYTLIIAPSSTIAVNVTLYKSLPYDPVKDFIPLAVAARTPFVLVVNPSVPVKTVAELVAYGKAQAKPLIYATAGNGVPHHLFAELLKSLSGLPWSPVPYKGSMPALQDVMAGHVPVMFVDLGPALAQVQAGTVRALAVSTAQRLPSLPDVPAVNDTYKGFDVASWQMILAPAGTPRAIVEKLHKDINAVLADPDVRSRIAKAGMVPDGAGSLAELEAFVKEEVKRWGEVVRKAGIAGLL